MKKQTKRSGGILSMPCEISVILHLICTFLSINATNIVRNSCGTQAAFYKIASDHAMQIANKVQKTSNADVTGCVDFCVENYTCKAFNYKKRTKICELLHYDRNEKATLVAPKTGWNYYDTGLYSSQVGQFCRSLTYNPCYPCQCFDSCEGAEMFKCNCTNGVATLPDVYLAFESTPDKDNKIQYDRGHDGVGTAAALISTNAFVEEKRGRHGKVLALRGVAPIAKIGANFQGTAVKDPGLGPLSVSFWLKVDSAYSGEQKMFSTGKSGLTNGILVKLKSSATTISVSIFGKTKMAEAEANIGDALTTTWCHFAFTSNLAKAPYLLVYLNGRKVATDTSLTSKSYSSLDKWPQLVFGTRTFHPGNGESWNMQMDDLAIWYQELTEDQISFVATKGYI